MPDIFAYDKVLVRPTATATPTASNTPTIMPTPSLTPTASPTALPGHSQQSITYAYDPLYRLTAAEYGDGGYFRYTYDAVGNRLTEESNFGNNTYVYDIANRLTSVNGVNYTWDANGNLLNDGVNTYTYDTANRLVSITAGASTTTYGYNGTGDRLRQTVGAATTNYTLDLNTGLTQVLADGTNTYLYGNGRLGEQQPGGFVYHLPDALGSVRQLSTSSGAPSLSQTFKPFGERLTSGGSGASHYGFTGEWQQGGLVFLRARYYAPGSGRFLNGDPSRQERNLFAYVDNNPATRIDPSGLKGQWSWDYWQAQNRDVDLLHDIGSDDPAKAFRAITVIAENFDRGHFGIVNDVQEYCNDSAPYSNIPGNPQARVRKDFNRYDWLFSGWADYWYWHGMKTNTNLVVSPNLLKALAWRETGVGTNRGGHKGIMGVTTYISGPLLNRSNDSWRVTHYDLGDSLSRNRPSRYNFVSLTAPWNSQYRNVDHMTYVTQEIGAAARWLLALNYNANYDSRAKIGRYSNDTYTWMRVLENYGPRPAADQLCQYDPFYSHQILKLYETGSTYRRTSAGLLGLGFSWSDIKSLYQLNADGSCRVENGHFVYRDAEAAALAQDYAGQISGFVNSTTARDRYLLYDELSQQALQHTTLWTP